MIREFKSAAKILFFPKRWANEIVRWIAGIHSKSGTVQVSNTLSPGSDGSLSLDVNMEAVTEKVKGRLGFDRESPLTRTVARDLVFDLADGASIINNGRRLSVSLDWLSNLIAQQPHSSVDLSDDATKPGRDGTGTNEGGTAGIDTQASRSDHAHPLNVSSATPSDVVISSGSASSGTSGYYAREDHVHKLPNNIPATDINFGSGVTNVTSANLSTYGVTTVNGSKGDVTVKAGHDFGGTGTANTVSHSDHTHTHSGITDWSTATANFLTDADLSDYETKDEHAADLEHDTDGCFKSTADASHSNWVNDIIVYKSGSSAYRLNNYFNSSDSYKIYGSKIQLSSSGAITNSSGLAVNVGNGMQISSNKLTVKCKSSGGLTATSDGLALGGMTANGLVVTDSSGVASANTNYYTAVTGLVDSSGNINYVTLNTDQTITGSKTFTSSIICSNAIAFVNDSSTFRICGGTEWSKGGHLLLRGKDVSGNGKGCFSLVAYNGTTGYYLTGNPSDGKLTWGGTTTDTSSTTDTQLPTLGYINSKFLRKGSGTGLLYSTSGTITYKTIGVNEDVAAGNHTHGNIKSDGSYNGLYDNYTPLMLNGNGDIVAASYADNSVHLTMSASSGGGYTLKSGSNDVYFRVLNTNLSSQSYLSPGALYLNGYTAPEVILRDTSNTVKMKVGCTLASTAGYISVPDGSLKLTASANNTTLENAPTITPGAEGATDSKAIATCGWVCSNFNIYPTDPGSVITLGADASGTTAYTNTWTYNSSSPVGIKIWVQTRTVWTGTKLIGFRRLHTYAKNGMLYYIGPEVAYDIDTPTVVTWS